VTLSRQLDEVVQRITNWLRDPDTKIEATDLEAARNAILAESRFREDAFPHELLPAVRRGLYGDHPYGSAAGPGSLSSLQLSQIQSWATRQLVNVHPYLLVLGDFEGTSFLQGLISQLSDRRYKVRKKFERPFEFNDDSHGRAASGQYVLTGLPGPEAHTYSRQVLDVAQWLLGDWQGTVSRRLQDQKLASRFTLFTEAGLNGGGLFLELKADPSRSREAAEAMQNVLNQLDGNSFGQDEHFDALVATITRRHLLVEDSRLLLHDLMLAVLSGEDARYRSREEGIIKSLTPAEVLSTARRYFVFPQ
jgi:predicted Zn-dependent peptidase